jgi:hypothetical protein
MNRIATLLATAVLALSAPALAHDYSVGALKIGHPWARPTPTGAIAGAGYLTITNTGKAPDRLLGGTTPVSDKLEVHEMSMTGGVMRMRPVEGGLTIAPGQTVELKPGGYHIMFIGLKKPFKLGDHLTATLKFEKAGPLRVDFYVQTPEQAGKPMAGGHDHMEMK